MRHGADEAVGDAGSEAGISIESDDVADRFEPFVRLAVNSDEGGVFCAGDETVEFVELASFALPTHPFAFAFVPETAPMK